MYDVLRLEIWNRGPAMVLVTVCKGAVYEVRYTDDQNVINDVLAWGGNPTLLKVEELTMASEFGIPAAAEKYAKRFLLERMKGEAAEWECLYNGPLIITAMTRDWRRFPDALVEMKAEPPPVVSTEAIVSGESTRDFAARFAARRKARQAEKDREGKLASLSASGLTVLRAQIASSPPKVANCKVKGSTGCDAYEGRLLRVTSRPPYVCEIEAPITTLGYRVEWSLNGETFAVSNPDGYR